mmetsp:Transcript_37526/g.88188  ORF Transcript_37526/g.88188 Transcript_37526/m.88188 type:complete len:611 (+) Transcript_37526:67-1899(+)
MLQMAAQFLLLSGLLVAHAARMELRHAEQGLAHSESAVVSEATLQEEAVQELRRYRALDEDEFQRFMAGENISLITTSLREDDTDVQLPWQWQSKLLKKEKLGEDAFGKVFKCKVLCERYKEIYVSVKLIVDKKPIVRQEIQVLESMRGVSDYCISAVGEPPFIDNSDGYWIMMPYMNGGELHDFLGKCRRNLACINADEGRKDWTQVDPFFTTSYILGLFHDMVAGVQALHEKAGLLHIDLKPANVMLNCEGHRCYAAVIDLGLACDHTKAGCGGAGTPLYIPGEVYRGDRNGRNSPARDVWALGLILYQLIYRNLPPWFLAKTRDQMYGEIMSYDVTTDRNVPNTKKVDTLVRAMLHSDWTKRPSLKSILSYVKGIVQESDPVDHNAVAMVKYSPTQRSASVAIPTCLDQKEETTTTTTTIATTTTHYRHYADEGLYQPSGAVNYGQRPRRPPPPVPTTSTTVFHVPPLKYDDRRRYVHDYDRRRHYDEHRRRHVHDYDRHRPLVSPPLEDEPTTTAYNQLGRMPENMQRRVNELVPGLRQLTLKPTPAPRQYNPNDYAPPIQEYNPNNYLPPGQPPIRLLRAPRPSFLESEAAPHHMQEEAEQDVER